jgi:membrane fusion protein (multidrug efflux system)
MHNDRPEPEERIMTRSNKLAPSPLFLLLPLALAAAPACNRASAADKSAEKPGAAAAAESAIAVQTQEATLRPVTQALTLTGTLLPNRRSDVAADAAGKVAFAPVERGMMVAAGATLVRLDRRSAALASEEARAVADVARTQQSAAETECARAEKLWSAGAINDAEHDRATAQCAAARSQAAAASARARLAGKNLGDATVRAPFRGLVADRFVNQGEYVRPDTRVATIVEIDSLRLELSVPEAAVGVIQKAGDVAFQVAAFPGESFRAKVRYIGPAVRRQTRDLLVEAMVPNKDHRLLPGMFATARLTTGSEPRPVVPAAAVKRGGDADRIYVVANGRVEERLVALGAAAGEDIVVVSGVRAGERVAVPVTDALRDGARVR